ncbi:MAG: 3-dehydroquinate synthase [Bacteroidales bacterium]|nr:3-dehydroquinate synthase [Bacteroidales bacterium]MDD4822498.1 3-dehydroquinate synthase [Bacteroidales bacterium]
MGKQQICICNSLQEELQNIIVNTNHDHVFVLTDTHTEKYCLPLIRNVKGIDTAQMITIPADDINKNVESLSSVWSALSRHGATRHSLMINLGGGMVTDLGGFAASTFKRGIRYINIPTTLLSMVDAAVGGKTGINFNGLKNEVGVFNTSEYVLIDTEFLKTIDRTNLLSGYAEMLKHGLISTQEEWHRLLTFDMDEVNYEKLKEMVAASVAIKEKVVNEDPYEKGIRKALNLGHTVGHAFESLSFLSEKPLAHGYAVAFGLICELYLSHVNCGFPKTELQQILTFIKENYGVYAFGCSQYEELFELMTHDKKNESKDINFTLLSNIGEIHINQTASKEQIFEMFDFYRYSLGI